MSLKQATEVDYFRKAYRRDFGIGTHVIREESFLQREINSEVGGDNNEEKGLKR